MKINNKEMKRKKEATLNCIQITQQFNPELWPNDMNKQIIITQDIKAILSEIVKRINKVASVNAAYAINHNQDTKQVYDLTTAEAVTQLVTPHITIVLRFSVGATLTELANAIGMPHNRLQKAKRGRNGYEHLLSYLIHGEDGSKFQYAPTDVVTLIGRNFIDIYKEKFSKWEKTKAKKKTIQTYDDIDLLIDHILNQKISIDQITSNKKYLTIFNEHKEKIIKSFETVAIFKASIARADINRRLFKKTVIFLGGPTSGGKTDLAKEMAEAIKSKAYSNGEIWQSTCLASTNMIDDYMGEEIIILDEARGESLDAANWLKLLDPYNINKIGARYKNKEVSARVIIITCSRHPLDCFRFAKRGEDEDLSQFIRRIDVLITVQKNKKIEYSEAYCKEIDEQAIIIPGTNITTTLTYNFVESSIKRNKTEILQLIVSLVGINNQWTNWDKTIL